MAWTVYALLLATAERVYIDGWTDGWGCCCDWKQLAMWTKVDCSVGERSAAVAGGAGRDDDTWRILQRKARRTYTQTWCNDQSGRSVRPDDRPTDRCYSYSCRLTGRNVRLLLATDNARLAITKVAVLTAGRPAGRATRSTDRQNKADGPPRSVRRGTARPAMPAA